MSESMGDIISERPGDFIGIRNRAFEALVDELWQEGAMVDVRMRQKDRVDAAGFEWESPIIEPLFRILSPGTWHNRPTGERPRSRSGRLDPVTVPAAPWKLS